MGIGYNPSIVTNGLVLYLDAGNVKSYPGNGTTWTDLSGNGNHGGMAAAVAYSTECGGCMNLSGSATGIWTNLDAQPTALPTATWMCFLKPANVSGLQMIMSTDDGGYDRTVETSRGDGNFNIFTGGGSWAAAPTTVGAWQFICVVYAAADHLFYKNSTQYARGAAFSGGATTGRFTIGCAPSGSERYAGLVNNVMVYNRALTAAEVSQNFNALRGRFGI